MSEKYTDDRAGGQGLASGINRRRECGRRVALSKVPSVIGSSDQVYQATTPFRIALGETPPLARRGISIERRRCPNNNGERYRAEWGVAGSETEWREPQNDRPKEIWDNRCARIIQGVTVREFADPESGLGRILHIM